METIHARGYVFEESGTPLRRIEFTVDTIPADETVVQVAGCGLCHTDLSFYSGRVKPHKMPVILGHEISGTVVAAGLAYEKLIGKNVIVPAVIPCGDCPLCQQGRANVCPNQLFPGNHRNGGFATHVVVPGRFLCEVPEETGGLELSALSVIADAITTPYQAFVRSNLDPWDVAIVVGIGGIGTYMTQIARNAGATVIALDIDENKLRNARRQGAHYTVNTRGMNEGDVKKTVRQLVKENKLPKTGWKVFETSGTAGGQLHAFSLLSFAGTLGVVGFTMDKVNIRLSNVMAFDGDIFGNWGCHPRHYPDVLQLVIDGSINVQENIEQHPLDTINDVITLAMEHKLDKRAVFVP